MKISYYYDLNNIHFCGIAAGKNRYLSKKIEENMDPIPYYFESINRNAIIVKPNKPFYDWLNNIDPNEDHQIIIDENNVYLIGEMDSNKDIQSWIENNFDRIFINELNDWNTNEELWPANRTFKMFSDWFQIGVHSMILDLEEYPVSKE